MKELRNKGRRAFLRGLGGTAVALPFLEFTHEKAWAQTGVARRFVTMFAHGGVITNQAADKIYSGNGKESGTNLWKPADPGEALVLGTIHQPLQDHVDKLLSSAVSTTMRPESRPSTARARTVSTTRSH